jgi:glycosyltransferase involved in cell wall biosynthesis
MGAQGWSDDWNQQRQPRIAVLIPVFNEAARIHLNDALTQKLCAAFAAREEAVAIVFVNDASTDETARLLEQTIARQPRNQGKIRLAQITLAANTRKAGIYLVARHQVVADYYLFIDADDSFAIADVLQMLQLVQQYQYDLVVGHKPVADESTAWARAAIRCVNRLLSKPLLPAGITDSQTGLKVFRRHVVDTAFAGVKAQHGFTADLVVLHAAKQLGFNVHQYFVQCIHHERSHVNILQDSIHHLQVISLLYLARLRQVRLSRSLPLTATAAMAGRPIGKA